MTSMSGFDVEGLLPFYLDETDEHIVALNDALLKLEQSPSDEQSLRAAFRLAHSIKGSAAVMGFAAIKTLMHHFETLFEGFRDGIRTLDRPFLDLCFRCLDALRDYHRDLRSRGESTVDLSELTEQVINYLNSWTGTETEATPVRPTVAEVPEPLAVPPEIIETSPAVCLTLQFEPDLAWADMKAKLVLTRLSAKARILATEPPAERLEEVESLKTLIVWLAAECDLDELYELANVDGVTEIQFETRERTDAKPSPADLPPAEESPSNAPEPAPPTLPSEAVKEPAASPAPPTSPLGSGVKPEPAPTGAEPKHRITETVRVDVDRLDHLMNLAGELVINKARFFEIARGWEELFRGSNAELLAADMIDRLDSVARGVDGCNGAHGLGGGEIERWSAQLKKLRENFRAIQEEIHLIRQGREQLGAMAEAIHHLTRISDGIQKGVLETRMVPIGPLFERFHRVVRDLRLSSGKEVLLRIEGEKTELDKRMIDELGDPLIHMVRNAVDHGLEGPDRREAVGKPRVGTISLSASHRANSVVITVADDGRGIDAERVRRKVVATGLLSESESLRLNERQLIPYIFHPGLSTAETITEVSGRGVGMDIVKSRIESLNGLVDVRTEPGKGTTFVIRLPLTLAILPVLLTLIGEEAYAIPLDHLDEIVEVRPDQINRIHGKRVFEIRGRVVSLVALSDVFRWSGKPGTDDSTNSVDTSGGKQTVVVVSNGDSTIGLIVDELLGMQEAVLKSLEKNYRPIPGLSGASILGDGRVSLILDIDTLIEMVASESVEPVSSGTF
jgi:two-component system chemotaxis sensor kinase CheA